MSIERVLWEQDATGLAELVHKGEIATQELVDAATRKRCCLSPSRWRSIRGGWDGGPAQGAAIGQRLENYPRRPISARMTNLPDQIRSAILDLIGRCQERGSVTLDELNLVLARHHDLDSDDIDGVFALIVDSDLRIEE
ncbi:MULTISPECIES: RNA polymerase sigma factor region1.1 domain-containing protein [unclassified Mesorhizobium]|uniref:RNA polymerase sigma factor region1.1 domain-containing protein n=1 Tax=unclassified Mesorhizobium TaxID=325217 RepID=UPI0015E294C0|nr:MULTISPECIES: RNA polymerase sigma factor region1.1 domain-containing protein [unclassified Mesorhizobium]MBZ9844825.1 hypothetical protein [Mesorhizobium sp. CA5]